jgi:transcriptional regulator with XRE-family HTH domain
MPKAEEQDELALQIGRELKQTRDAQGMAVMELHRRTGISRTVLQGYEAGRFKPGSGELKRLCEALGISPTKLLFGREDFGRDDPSTSRVDGLEANAAKAAIVIGLLSSDERRAVMTIVTRLLEARIGGGDLQKLMDLADAALPAIAGEPGLDAAADAAVRKLAETRPDLVAGEERTQDLAAKGRRRKT